MPNLSSGNDQCRFLVALKLSRIETDWIGSDRSDCGTYWSEFECEQCRSWSQVGRECSSGEWSGESGDRWEVVDVGRGIGRVGGIAEIVREGRVETDTLYHLHIPFQ